METETADASEVTVGQVVNREKDAAAVDAWNSASCFPHTKMRIDGENIIMSGKRAEVSTHEAIGFFVGFYHGCTYRTCCPCKP